MSITTTESISGKGSKIPPCAVCKQKRPGVLYTQNYNGQPVCEPCSGRSAQVIKIIPKDDG